MSESKTRSIIFRIARTELSALFCSPIAWFILIVFSVLTSVNFTAKLASAISSAEAYGYWDNVSLSYLVFLGNNGCFQKIVSNLFIYIPLLTMGLISRETASGSIKLTYSSPVTTWQFVLGKFLASVEMNLCLLAVPIISAAAGPFFIDNFDFLPILVALLGIFLLACTYSAIGLFMSSVTSYQVVAAVGTLISLAALTNISRIGPGYDISRNITHWLSLSGRTSSFLSGVIRSDDVIYFLAITLFFIIITVCHISFPRKNMSRLKKTGAYFTIAVMLFVAASIFSNPRLTAIYDATRNKSQSITEESKEIVKQIPGKIVVNNYVNMLDTKSTRYLPAKFYQYKSIFEQYKLVRPDIEEHTIYYYASSPFNVLSSSKLQGMTLEQGRDYIATVYNLNPRMYKSPEKVADVKAIQDEMGTLVHEIVTENGRVEYIRDYNDNEVLASEAEITSTLSKFISDPPIVGFTAGNGERLISGQELNDYSDFTIDKYFRYALVNQGFDISQITLDDSVPEDIGMMVVADPSEKFTAGQLDNLKQYLSRGGNLIFLTDYSNTDIAAPVLTELGLVASDRQLAQREGDNTASLTLSKVVGDSVEGFAVRGKITMPGCVALDTLGHSPFNRTVLLSSGPDSWLEKDYEGFRDDAVECDDASESVGTFNTGYALTNNEQRIIVLGDADCFSNSELTIVRENVDAANFAFITDCFRWISDGKFPFKVVRQSCTDDRFLVSSEIMTVVKAIYIFIIPLLMLMTSLFILIRRRKG